MNEKLSPYEGLGVEPPKYANSISRAKLCYHGNQPAVTFATISESLNHSKEPILLNDLIADVLGFIDGNEESKAGDKPRFVNASEARFKVEDMDDVRALLADICVSDLDRREMGKGYFFPHVSAMLKSNNDPLIGAGVQRVLHKLAEKPYNPTPLSAKIANHITGLNDRDLRQLAIDMFVDNIGLYDEYRTTLVNNSDPNILLRVYSDYGPITARFEKNGIEITYPQKSIDSKRRLQIETNGEICLSGVSAPYGLLLGVVDRRIQVRIRKTIPIKSAKYGLQNLRKGLLPAQFDHTPEQLIIKHEDDDGIIMLDMTVPASGFSSKGENIDIVGERTGKIKLMNLPETIVMIENQIGDVEAENVKGLRIDNLRGDADLINVKFAIINLDEGSNIHAVESYLQCPNRNKSNQVRNYRSASPPNGFSLY